MANIFTGSIGKKFVMSISGLFLILFLTMHTVINSISIVSKEAFNAACDFMGSPIVSIMVPILALGFIIHIIYATVVTIGDLKARGGLNRYASGSKAKTDSWAARNMIILGIIILGFLAFHFYHFWLHMQYQLFTGGEVCPDPYGLLLTTFGKPWITALYIVWFVALWFHLTHGFWSAFSHIGWNNDKWLPRLKVIAYIVATLLCGALATVAIVNCLRFNGILPSIA
ncbi:MAG: succinate dehydrogenase cytochrome b subunit [Bacteroidales bacterium]|jgi:succinate dehydrogenase / fumarate reductase cytochrome b subunit|nr:succinate dehydrogenase cytochrome b subunit [Bacteroidales bacterium]MCI2121099.1 succinate dehydrogenase cytochrome b subunit [Bacteroidales bacterium]MCI2144914.1 succinate dehydrogenase cytochrome b subunit [Bacteroidales bacterium]